LDFGATTEALVAEREYATPAAILHLNPKSQNWQKFRHQELFYIV